MKIRRCLAFSPPKAVNRRLSMLMAFFQAYTTNCSGGSSSLHTAMDATTGRDGEQCASTVSEECADRRSCFDERPGVRDMARQAPYQKGQLFRDSAAKEQWLQPFAKSGPRRRSPVELPVRSRHLHPAAGLPPLGASQPPPVCSAWRSDGRRERESARGGRGSGGKA